MHPMLSTKFQPVQWKYERSFYFHWLNLPARWACLSMCSFWLCNEKSNLFHLCYVGDLLISCRMKVWTELKPLSNLSSRPFSCVNNKIRRQRLKCICLSLVQCKESSPAEEKMPWVWLHTAKYSLECYYQQLCSRCGNLLKLMIKVEKALRTVTTKKC